MPALPRRRTTAVAVAGIMVACLGLASCSDGGSEDSDVGAPTLTGPPASAAGTPDPATGAGRTPSIGNPRVAGVIARNIDVPWGLVFLPGGDALVAERDTAKVRRIRARDGAVDEVGTIDGVVARGEGGLLGLAVSPGFADDATVFAYFTAAADNRIVRLTLRDDRLSGQQVILSGIPKGGTHNGGRMTFGPDGMLYVGTGESGDKPLAQQLSSLGGKILRITPDGKPAPGNPFPGSVVFSYGHRNVQGVAFDRSGRLWAAEFGQNTWDELNLIQAGGNYGWPQVEGREGGGDGFIDPVAQWATDQASPSGIAVVGDAVYMAGLRGRRLWQIPIAGAGAGEGVGEPKAFLTGDYGRLRTVELAPDGSLWLTTSNTDGRGSPDEDDDRILRVSLG